MKYDKKSFLGMFSRRVFFIGVMQSLLFGVLGIRIWWLQIQERQKYFDLAEGNRIDIRFLLPTRGRILTDDLIPIADIRPEFEIVLIPYRVKSLEPTLEKLNKITPIPQEKIEEIKKLNKHLYRYAVIPIKSFYDWNEAIEISDRLHTLPGIDMVVGSKRVYASPELFSHVTGYVGEVNKQEQDADPDHILRIPNMKIGKQGVEKVQDSVLRGKAGALKVEVNHVGHVRRELSRTDPMSGDDIHLTLNFQVQKAAAEAMGEQSGATVLLNVKTGAVLALCSTPGFDPNLFTDGISYKNWNLLRNDEKAPMNNKAIIGQYPPGSTFKMITLLAALETGTIKPEDKIFCPGHYVLGEGRFHCWKKGGHGWVDAVHSLMLSCDVYFYDVGLRTGMDNIAKVARRYGLGKATGIDLAFEKAGLIPDSAWKMERYGKQWLKGETIISSIGQGSVLATPLQLAVMTARLATDTAVTPHLIAGKVQKKFPVLKETRPEFTQILREGMFAVVNTIGGTASSGKIQPEFGMAAGKTGTAQVRRISAGERKRGVLQNDQLEWRYRDHALYVSFAPFDNPVFAVATVVEHGGSGSKVAAPIATATLKKAFEIYSHEYGLQDVS